MKKFLLSLFLLVPVATFAAGPGSPNPGPSPSPGCPTTGCGYSGLVTFYNGLAMQYSPVGGPTDYAVVNNNNAYTLSGTTSGARPRYWSDAVTVNGTVNGPRVLEPNFFNVIFSGTGTLNNEAFNILHPYSQFNSGVTLAGYGENIEASSLVQSGASVTGTLNHYLSTLNIASGGNVAVFQGFRALVTNSGTLGVNIAYKCEGVGGTAPTVGNLCLQNTDPTASIQTAGGMTIGSIGQTPATGQLYLIGSGTGAGTIPLLIKNSALNNLMSVDNAGDAVIYNNLTVGTAGSIQGILTLNSLTSGYAIRLVPPSGGSGIQNVTLPGTASTLATLTLAQTFSGAQTFGTINLNGSVNVGGNPGVSCAAGSVSLATLVVTNGIITHC